MATTWLISWTCLWSLLLKDDVRTNVHCALNSLFICSATDFSYKFWNPRGWTNGRRGKAVNCCQPDFWARTDFLFLLIDIIWQGELWYQHKSKKEIWRRNSFSVSSVIGDQWDCRQWHSSNPHSAPNAQRWSRFTLAAFLDMCFNIICLHVEKHWYWFFMLLSFPFWFSFTSKIDQFPGALWRLKHPLSLCRREKPLRLGKFHKTWNKTLFVPCIGSGGGGASTSVHGSHRIPPKNWHLWRQLLKNGILADFLSFDSRYAHASWRKCGKAWWSTKF